MSMRELESSICLELRSILKNKKIRVKDMMEWRTSEIEPHDGEVVVFLGGSGVFVAVKKELDKR